jgi:alginate O-acetyltransferase complex protein AlgI
MLFSSYEFLFFFLPLVTFGFYALGAVGGKLLAMTWLTIASLFFYGWWNPIYLPLIGVSILFNFAVSANTVNATASDRQRKMYLILGLVGNLALLGYFKYANFFMDNLNILLDVENNLSHIVLPLAISFFTFQQIAYLVDTYQSRKRETNFLRYSLFVCFFPQLIAGPIVHHKEMLPQFEKDDIYQADPARLSLGISILIIGLAKKVLLADNISVYANPVFDAAAQGEAISTLSAWVASMAYTFQLYFDFSGYSDMALGLGLMFGVRLPLNFNSPLKASSMIDFWRRWHMTLSQFLQAYLFLPFSMKEIRRGWTRQPIFSFIATMALGGLWHGASWTFVLWGLFHGFLLAINQVWRTFKKRFGLSKPRWWSMGLGRVTILLCWMFSLVIFRSEDLQTAWRIMQGLVGYNNLTANNSFIDAYSALPLLFGLAIIVWLAPNTVQIFSKYCIATGAQDVAPAKSIHLTRSVFCWRPNPIWAVCLAVLLVLSILSMHKVNEFLYFQF